MTTADTRPGPSLETSHYVPEGYTATINSMLDYPWPKDAGPGFSRESERAMARIVIAVADLYVAGEYAGAAGLVAEKLSALPAEWSPVRYFQVVAEAMALPVWERYTQQQRQRGYEYAARYVRARLYEWLRPSHRHSADGKEPEKFVLGDLSRVARIAFTEQVVAKTDYRRWLAQVQAYAATHPDDEFVPAELRQIMNRWRDRKLPQAFF